MKNVIITKLMCLAFFICFPILLIYGQNKKEIKKYKIKTITETTIVYNNNRETISGTAEEKNISQPGYAVRD